MAWDKLNTMSRTNSRLAILLIILLIFVIYRVTRQPSPRPEQNSSTTLRVGPPGNLS